MLEGETAHGLLAHSPLIESWASQPIPYLSLSAGGLLALADLNTVAQRTAITGGSSWLDALVLAPGLHYQQAADALEQENVPSLAAELGLTAAVETRPDGTEVRRYVIRNIATVNYLKRLWGSGDVAEGSTVTINVGAARQTNSDDAERLLRRATSLLRQRRLRRTKPAAQHRGVVDVFDLDWLSHLFYVASPVLTVAASTFMVLLSDWWGLGFIVSLMASRLLNIYTIRKRCQPLPPPTSSAAKLAGVVFGPVPENRPTEYVIELGPSQRVVLRGLSDDLQAVTTQAWLRGKTNVDGYLEAASKLIVYMVAAFSGNLTQAGAIVLMMLLLLSAGLLGLSNAHIRGLQMHGRVARPETERVGDAKMFDAASVDLEEGRRDGFPVEDVRGR
ncbi:hypothetical protein PWT90_05567 [Aphanocladium album]|nr:hypothetical protein PWT90_05567 [Aphanocladium album]